MSSHSLLLAQLSTQVCATIGTDGGHISPSLYDTAQQRRFSPTLSNDTRDAIQTWLFQQQEADGGWGDPIFPWSRGLSTLAILLACPPDAQTRSAHRTAWDAGFAFLHEHASLWGNPLTDELPVGIELVLPQLLRDAQTHGLSLPMEPYSTLIHLGQQRRARLRDRTLRPGTPPLHSWESFGGAASPDFVDGSGGIGHSPSATVAWLAAYTKEAQTLAPDRTAMVQSYLAAASEATSIGIPGVIPGVWPITRFEHAFALYFLLIAGLLDHPALASSITPKVHALAQAMRPDGLGFSDYFHADGDDTAAACAVLWAAGVRAPDTHLVNRWQVADHFCAFPGELQSSVSVTAHAMHALHIAGQTHVPGLTYLLARQGFNGLWAGDKWHVSAMYTTSQVLIALPPSTPHTVLCRALEGILGAQHATGGWGDASATSASPPLTEETAYAVFALRALRQRLPMDTNRITSALARAKRWLMAQPPCDPDQRPRRWVDKELYVPVRLVRIVELSALLALLLDSTLDYEEAEAHDHPFAC